MNNTNKIFIVAGVVALILGVLAYIFLGGSAMPQNQKPASENQFPSAGTATDNPNGSGGIDTITVAQIQQGSLPVRNFKNDPTTVTVANTPGYYYLAGGAYPALNDPPFQIMYDENHQYFAVAIYKEPLGAYRLQAEDVLQKALGISHDDMCKLNYFVGVGKGVNDLYLAKNLGFSFCPGATQLP